MTNSIDNIIQDFITNNDVVLFMKGTSQFPQCGFSATVVAILNKVGVEFLDINVLEDDEIRNGIKTFSDWPTIPQLYLKGEFIGGCDIVKELYQSGELQNILQNKNISYSE
jgi:monothiol glutaredoxin